jgi:hypothetical protein
MTEIYVSYRDLLGQETVLRSFSETEKAILWAKTAAVFSERAGDYQVWHKNCITFCLGSGTTVPYLKMIAEFEAIE